jgi:hypothetical protein
MDEDGAGGPGPGRVGETDGAEMSADKRIEYLLDAARRADNEGDRRTAQSLRRMAEEAKELEARKFERRPEPAQPLVGLTPALVGRSE